MALQTLTFGPSATLPVTRAVSSVDATDGLEMTITSDAVGEVHAWADAPITLAAGGGDAVPLPHQSHAHDVPVRVWLRADAQVARALSVTLKAASGTATVYVAAFPRATGV